MNKSTRFLYRKQWKALRGFWIDGEKPETVVHGRMKENGLFIQTNLRQIWAPLKGTKKRTLSQKSEPIQMVKKGERAAIRAGTWHIVDVDAGAIARLATPAPPKPQPKRRFVKSIRKPTAQLTPEGPKREDNARKARARILLDKGQISQKEYDWMTK